MHYMFLFFFTTVLKLAITVIKMVLQLAARPARRLLPG